MESRNEPSLWPHLLVLSGDGKLKGSCRTTVSTMTYLSRRDIDDLGMRVFSDYKRLPIFQGQFIQRVEPELLAHHLCGLKIGYFHLSAYGKILGLTIVEKANLTVADDDWNTLIYPLDGKTILIEKSLYEDKSRYGQYHFTVAHEVAHQILDRLYPHRGGTNAKIRYSLENFHQTYPVKDWVEWQTNALASVLLMPTELVMSALSQFGLEKGIRILNKVFFPKDYENFCQVADMLGVSKRALSARLKRLGLLGESYLDAPYKLVDVEVWENGKDQSSGL